HGRHGGARRRARRHGLRVRPGSAPRRGRPGGLAPAREISALHPGLRAGRRRRDPRLGPFDSRRAPARRAGPGVQAPPQPDPQVRRPRHGGRPDAGPQRLSGLRPGLRRRRARTDRPRHLRARDRDRRVAGIRLRQRRGCRPAAA
ncbi:hypothetical protein OY671_012966, partial [Metschnikowia pulcherrima]